MWMSRMMLILSVMMIRVILLMRCVLNLDEHDDVDDKCDDDVDYDGVDE